MRTKLGGLFQRPEKEAGRLEELSRPAKPTDLSLPQVRRFSRVHYRGAFVPITYLPLAPSAFLEL